jgi:hypothetical protein
MMTRVTPTADSKFLVGGSGAALAKRSPFEPSISDLPDEVVACESLETFRVFVCLSQRFSNGVLGH